MSQTESKFPKFWYESNACWGWIKTLEDLKEALGLQLRTSLWGIFSDVDEFLDRSYQNIDGSLDFGTRREHQHYQITDSEKSKKSLRAFLIKHNLLKDFLNLVK